MQIENAIVHLIKKDQHQDPTLQLAATVLEANEGLTSLVDKLRKLYNEKASLGYGKFQDSITAYPLSGLLKKHQANELDFVGWSREAMDLLKQRIDSAATGGHVIFVRYQENGSDFMLIASLKDRSGVGFNEKLELTERGHIDLDHVHEMARINITSWLAKGDRYLSFAKGRAGRSDFTHYFREFIGCTEFTESKTLTSALVHAVKQYGIDQGLDEEKRLAIRQETFDYLEAHRAEGVSLDALSHRFSDDDPDAFRRYLNENPERFPISDGFKPDRSIYRALKRVSLRSSAITISFDAELLQHQIMYDKAAGTLLIKELPNSFRMQLDQT